MKQYFRFTEQSAVIGKTFLKKATYLLMALCMVTVFYGCPEKDADEEKQGNEPNKFIFEGETYTATNGVQLYYGHYPDYGNNANNITLLIAVGDFVGYFEMFVPNGETKLVKGTYTKRSVVQAYSFIEGGLLDSEGEELLYVITAGTVRIDVSGTTYTIDVECTFDDGSTVTGNYTGALEWSDESGGSASSGSLTAQTGNESQKAPSANASELSRWKRIYNKKIKSTN